ncbi:MAG: hypothetical protein WCJ24_01370 [Candidatus Saccharibacteria bacterium]
MPETNTPYPETTQLYRVENPTIAAVPNDVNSRKGLVGQWFTPDLDTAMNYIRKSTQTFGKNAGPVNGAQMIVAEVPTTELNNYKAVNNPSADGMDIENDNYLVPRDGSVPTKVISLDSIVDDLRGGLGNVDKLKAAKKRVLQELGKLSLK